jgi:putative hydrolase of the HAD superfamily
MMQKLLQKHPLKKAIVVFDLDDTLYEERYFYESGVIAVITAIESIKKTKVSKKFRSKILMKKNFLDYVCDYFSLNSKEKLDLLSVYRNHKPSIELTNTNKNLIETLVQKCMKVIILTDGRSTTQKNKLNSLGLINLEHYISEEYKSEKPDLKRFILIENKYPDCKYFYIGDNTSKDFIAPNQLGWETIGLEDKGNNIHAQKKTGLPKINQPKIWIKDLIELI